MTRTWPNASLIYWRAETLPLTSLPRAAGSEPPAAQVDSVRVRAIRHVPKRARTQILTSLPPFLSHCFVCAVAFLLPDSGTPAVFSKAVLAGLCATSSPVPLPF